MFKNVKIGKKLIIAFIALGLVVSIAGFVGLGLMVNLDKSYSTALVENGFVQGDIGDFNAYLNRGAAMTRDVIMLTNPVDIQSAQAELKDASEKAVAALEAARVNCQSPEELAIFAKIDAASPKYTEARERAVALGLQNKNDEALQVFRNDAKPYLNECVTAGQELMALNVTMGNAASANLSAQSAFGVMTIIAVIIAGLVIAIILGIFIARDISKPLGEIEKVAEKMAAGDFDVDIKYNSRNEIGALANS
ncbi:MAG: MCP four helix bundle domain-containing protein, partial [Angelakisella sp.]